MHLPGVVAGEVACNARRATDPTLNVGPSGRVSSSQRPTPDGPSRKVAFHVGDLRPSAAAVAWPSTPERELSSTRVFGVHVDDTPCVGVSSSVAASGPIAPQEGLLKGSGRVLAACVGVRRGRSS